MDTEISTLARQIAEHLGGFTAVPHDHGVCLHGPGDQELWVCRMWNHRERAEIHGSYPPGEETGRLPRHQITVAISRPPEAIVTDITRRLLPAYRNDLKIARERIEQAAHDDENRARIAARLLAAIPHASAAESKRETAIHWFDDTAGSGTIRLHGNGGSATIERHRARPQLTGRIADAVAAALRSRRGQ